MPKNNTDEALVRKFLHHRDDPSFRELYRRHTPVLYPLALRLCDSEADAHDAIQETWIQACGALAAFEWRSTLKTWLTGILIRCVRTQCRKRWRRQEEELPDDWADKIASSSITPDLDQTIAQLPEGYRQVLTLHDVEGYTHEEIGALLDISVGTSKSQLHHARRAVRKVF